MDITLTTGDTPIYQLRGKLSFADNEAMRPVLHDMGQGSGRTIVLDLSGLDYVDSFGIGLFLVALDEVKKAGNRLLIRNPQGAVKRIFTLANLDTLLEIEGTAAPAATPLHRPAGPASHSGLRVGTVHTAPNGEMEIPLSGRFTFNDHEEFEKVLASVDACKGRVLALDLRELDFMDSAGLSMMLIARDEAERKGIRLVLHSPGGRVAQLLRLAAVDTLVDVRAPA
ncbi:MAG: anti-sigma factor antagonist [Bacteroidales bacterium]